MFKYWMIQKTFLQDGGAQCGYCTPGMLMMSKALLDENQNPSEEEIRFALSGNLCRCTGYAKIVQAVQDAAAIIRAGGKSEDRRSPSSIVNPPSSGETYVRTDSRR